MVTTARRKTFRLISTERSRHERSIDISEDEAEPAVARIADEAPLADKVMLQLEQQHLTRVALAALDERCRKLLTLLFYEAEQPSYGEIALALGTSAGSIGPTRARCLEKMLRLLDK